MFCRHTEPSCVSLCWRARVSALWSLDHVFLDDQMCSPPGSRGNVPSINMYSCWGQIGTAICCVSQAMRCRGISLFCGAVVVSLLFPIFCFAFAALLCCIDWANDWTDACKLAASYCRRWLVCGCVCHWGLQRGGTPDRHAPTIHSSSYCFMLCFFFLLLCSIMTLWLSSHGLRIATKHLGVWLLNLLV